MTLDRSLLNRLMTSEYAGRGTRPAPVREDVHRFTHKEFLAEDIAERFHENTQLTANTARVDDRSVAAFRENETLQFARRRAPPDYRGQETVSLPQPANSLGVDVADAVTRDRGWNCSGDGLSRQQASTLLHYACGSPHRPGDEGANVAPDTDSAPSETGTARRTYSSPSGTYPIEPYVAVVNGGEGLEPGLYFYAADDHALRRLRHGDDAFVETVVESFVDDRVDVRDAAACLVLTGVFWRAKAKYGPRGYRLALQEAGHVMQNLGTVAAGMGLASVPCASVHEKRLESLFDANGVDESVAYAGAVGVPGDAVDAPGDTVGAPGGSR